MPKKSEPGAVINPVSRPGGQEVLFAIGQLDAVSLPIQNSSPLALREKK